jgi:hypothetical protein
LVGSRLETQIFGVDDDFVLVFLDTAEFFGVMWVLVDLDRLNDVAFQHVFTVVGLSGSFGSFGWGGQLGHVLFEGELWSFWFDWFGFFFNDFWILVLDVFNNGFWGSFFSIIWVFS